jgi:hypothetical protein
MTDAPKRIWINIDAPWDGLINPVHGTGGLPGYILDTPAALSEAPEVKALVAEAVERATRVKPLVWKQEAENAWVAAHYAVHQYWPHNNGLFAVSGYLGGLGAIALGKHPTLEAAKAAAQADYEQRIRAAIGGNEDE